jgi:PKD repeat protein
MKSDITLARRTRAVATRTAIALAIAATLLGVAASAASAATSAPAPFVVAHATGLERGDAVIGALPMNHPIHIEVAMKLRNKAVLDAFVANLASNRAKGIAVLPMTRDQVIANHAPTVQQAQAVADFLTRNGFTHVVIAGNRLRISADATALVAGRTFQTSFQQVRKRDGRIAYSNFAEARMPAELADKVINVLGLEDVHYAHTYAKQTPQGGVHTLFATHFPGDFSSIYDASSSAMPTAVTIGIITEGSQAQTIADLNTFTTNHSLPTVSVSTINTNGTSSDTANNGEWALDSQDIVGTAGGQVGGLILYNVPSLSLTNISADFAKVVNDDTVKITNVSLGLCETTSNGAGEVAADDPVFQVGVAQGQTFSMSTGDNGADECGNSTNAPQWPASSQYVTAVSGTTLDATSTTWNAETVWSGSGGSESLFEPKPSWQTLWSGTFRAAADVAFEGDPSSGVTLVISGSNSCCWGGTSLSSPIFVGLWARVLQAHPTIGFASPVIYALQASDFHDITSGSNGLSPAVGYDQVSGRGSMDFAAVLNDINTNNLGNHAPHVAFSYVRTGLSVQFTDKSTDDAAVFSHSWDFGDGSAVSTAANPSHVYAVNGSYSVTETVGDQVGATTAKTVVVTVASNQQLLRDTGFESASPNPWALPVGVLQNNASLAHAGNQFAELGASGISTTDRATQAVTIPAGQFGATLQFYLRVATAETTLTSVRDRLNVQVLDASTNVVLQTLATYSNLDASGSYAAHSFDMGPYIGQSVKIRFTGINNSAATTTWFLDDVTLHVH